MQLSMFLCQLHSFPMASSRGPFYFNILFVGINGKVGCACRIWRHDDVIWQLSNVLFCSITSSWRQI